MDILDVISRHVASNTKYRCHRPYSDGDLFIKNFETARIKDRGGSVVIWHEAAWLTDEFNCSDPAFLDLILESLPRFIGHVT